MIDAYQIFCIQIPLWWICLIKNELSLKKNSRAKLSSHYGPTQKDIILTNKKIVILIIIAAWHSFLIFMINIFAFWGFSSDDGNEYNLTIISISCVSIIILMVGMKMTQDSEKINLGFFIFFGFGIVLFLACLFFLDLQINNEIGEGYLR